ncbi:MAG: TIGR03960 family B12-binding radical SAM protein, partial [Candidatus Omnitrophota bacterium]
AIIINIIDVKQLEQILPTVSRPGRYLGNEWNVIKKDLDKAEVRFCLAFPDIYDIGMSYLGFRIIYGALNSREEVACERVFAPWFDFEQKLRENKIPLFSLESKAPLKEFDIIGFSLTYELNYTNVLNMLDLAGIPLRSKDRGEAFPLIIAGGPAAYNPAPMSEFIDAFIIGEGEEVVLEIVDAYKRVKELNSCVMPAKAGIQKKVVMDSRLRGNDRELLLKELANIEGIYVPKFPKEVKKRIVKDLDAAFYPTKDLVPYVQVIHDRITLEIMRGCPYSCSFCQASSFHRPVRLRSQEKILGLAKEVYRSTGHDEISLLSLSSSSYPDVAGLISKLVDEFKGLGVGVSLPSLRSDDILKSLPSLIVKVRKAGLTFAIEAGTERLRRHINKNIDTDKTILACGEAFSLGWRLVKFYFMIGLPTETYEDLDAIVDFLKKVLALKNNIEISVSVTAFIPKYGTAFENERMDSVEALSEKQKFLRDRFRDKRVKWKFHDARVSFVEGRLSRPDTNLSGDIYTAWQKGARLQGWREFFNFEIWRGLTI